MVNTAQIAYITAQAPFGDQETFVITEMLAAVELGANLVITPRNPPRKVFHEYAKALVGYTIKMPVMNFFILVKFLAEFGKRRLVRQVIRNVFRHSRSLKIAAKNLAVIPKAVYLAGRVSKSDIKHIHAHWASTTATMAWAISELTGIPWSFTLHRWDIAENNMLELKVKHASFARCISEDGRNEVLATTSNDLQEKVWVLHLGVPINKNNHSHSTRPEYPFVIACPANLVTKKGHTYLLQAGKLLIERGITGIQVLIIGDGPLAKNLNEQIRNLDLERHVKMVHRMQHDQLIQLYADGEVDAVVLPSIETEDGAKEGIPVALMEAMAMGIPVITTNTGGISELVNEETGVIVPQRDPVGLAEAIQTIMLDRKLVEQLTKAGRQRVREQFDLYKNTKTLLTWIAASS